MARKTKDQELLEALEKHAPKALCFGPDDRMTIARELRPDDRMTIARELRRVGKRLARHAVNTCNRPVSIAEERNDEGARMAFLNTSDLLLDVIWRGLPPEKK